MMMRMNFLSIMIIETEQRLKKIGKNVTETGDQKCGDYGIKSEINGFGLVYNL